MIETLQSYKSDLCSKGSACDVTRNANSLISRYKELVNVQQPTVPEEITRISVSFTPSNITDITTGRIKLMGNLIISGNLK